MTDTPPGPKTIACLGWGSLYWNPGALPLAGEWKYDGPVIPVEFLRRSSSGRVTLVLDAEGTKVPGLWVHLNCQSLPEAVEALRAREKTLARNIGCWSGGDPPPLIPSLKLWAQERHIDAVIWTALDYRSKDCQEKQSVEQLIAYLRGLSGKDLNNAREYVQRAPHQIATAFRKKFETELGWK